jgi:hypothetical protein
LERQVILAPYSLPSNLHHGANLQQQPPQP